MFYSQFCGGKFILIHLLHKGVSHSRCFRIHPQVTPKPVGFSCCLPRYSTGHEKNWGVPQAQAKPPLFPHRNFNHVALEESISRKVLCKFNRAHCQHWRSRDFSIWMVHLNPFESMSWYKFHVHMGQIVVWDRTERLWIMIWVITATLLTSCPRHKENPFSTSENGASHLDTECLPHWYEHCPQNVADDPPKRDMNGECATQLAIYSDYNNL